MAFCKNCGNQIDDKAVICPACGVAQKETPEDNGGLGWQFLGCCIPLLGLILWLVWKDTKPVTAKDCGKGALISVCLSVAYYVVLFIIGLVASM